MIITSVSLDPSTGKFNFVAETETDDKHAFALGESAVPPPPYALTPPDIVPPTPTVDAWGLGAALDNNGMPYLTIYGDLIGTVIDSVLVQYKRTDSTDWLNAGTIIVYQEDVVFHITGVDGGTDYEARIAYRNGDVLGPWRQLAAVTTPVSAIAAIEDEFADLAADTSAALAAIAAFEGQIDDLLDSVGTLEADIIAAGGEIDTLQTTVATQGSAITSNATTISGVAGDLASLVVTVGAQGASITSNSTAITSLNSSVASLNTTVATQGASIADNATAISTVDANLANVTLKLSAGGGNLLPNSGFEGGSSADWEFVSSGLSANGTINGAGDSWRPTGENVLSIHQNNATASGYADWRTEANVEQNKWYELSAYFGLHRASGSIYIGWFNTSGTQIGGWQSANVAASPTITGGTYLASYSRPSLKRQAPAGAVRAKLWLRKNPTTAGQSDSWLFIARPQFIEVFEDTASPVAYSTVARAVITQQASALSTLTGDYASLSSTVGVLGASVSSQAAALSTVEGDVTTLFSRWSLTVDVNGYWGGAEINNNGTTIGMKLRSDLLEISKPGGGERFEYSNGNIRIYDAANVLRVQLGVNF